MAYYKIVAENADLMTPIRSVSSFSSNGDVHTDLFCGVGTGAKNDRIKINRL